MTLHEVSAHLMKYVYLIQSLPYPNQWYVGITSDNNARLSKHNEGGSPHTSKHKPWTHVASIQFVIDAKAAAFEGYLKSGSGRAFANKHLW